MKKLLVLTIAVVLGMSMFVAYAVPEAAGEYTIAEGLSCATPSFSGPSFGSGYMGAMVLDPQDNELGRVFDVMSADEGTINFLIVSSCLPGMNDKVVAIPVWDLDTPQRLGTVKVSVTKEQFLGAPAISSQEWSNLGFLWTYWFEENNRYFGETY
jgi:hypothetical protein